MCDFKDVLRYLRFPFGLLFPVPEPLVDFIAVNLHVFCDHVDLMPAPLVIYLESRLKDVNLLLVESVFDSDWYFDNLVQYIVPVLCQQLIGLQPDWFHIENKLKFVVDIFKLYTERVVLEFLIILV